MKLRSLNVAVSSFMILLYAKHMYFFLLILLFYKILPIYICFWSQDAAMALRKYSWKEFDGLKCDSGFRNIHIKIPYPIIIIIFPNDFPASKNGRNRKNNCKSLWFITKFTWNIMRTHWINGVNNKWNIAMSCTDSAFCRSLRMHLMSHEEQKNNAAMKFMHAKQWQIMKLFTILLFLFCMLSINLVHLPNG